MFVTWDRPWYRTCSSLITENRYSIHVLSTVITNSVDRQVSRKAAIVDNRYVSTRDYANVPFIYYLLCMSRTERKDYHFSFTCSIQVYVYEIIYDIMLSQYTDE